MGTAIVLLVLLLAVCAIVKSMIRDKRNGKSIQCGGDCSHCGGACHYIHESDTKLKHASK